MGTINLRALDVLRGLLAVLVLAGHTRWLTWRGHEAWLHQPHASWEAALVYASAFARFGHEAVLVFFALSGFFIHFRAGQSLAQSGATEFRVRHYYVRRLHRLIPPYALAIIVTFGLDKIGQLSFPTLYTGCTGDKLLDDHFSSCGYSWTSVVPALCLLPGSFGASFGSNGPLWSLAYEVVYYALYPLWLMVRQRSPWLAYCGIPCGCISAAFVEPTAFPALVIAHYPIWLAGAGLCELAARTNRWLARLWPMAAALLGAFGGYLYCPRFGVRILFAVIYAAATIVLFIGLPPLIMENRLMRFGEGLGLRSYTIYVIAFSIAGVDFSLLH